MIDKKLTLQLIPGKVEGKFHKSFEFETFFWARWAIVSFAHPNHKPIIILCTYLEPSTLKGPLIFTALTLLSFPTIVFQVALDEHFKGSSQLLA